MRERLVTTVNVGIGVPVCCFQPLGCMGDQVRYRHMWLALPNHPKEEDFYHVGLSCFYRTVPPKKFPCAHGFLNQASPSKLVWQGQFKVTGEVFRLNIRLCERGFQQIPGIPYNESYAAVIKAVVWRPIIAIAAVLEWHLHVMDIKTAFGNALLLAYCSLRFWWKFCSQTRSSTRRLEVGST